MTETRELAARFEAYGDWRRRLLAAIGALRDWLYAHDLHEVRIGARLTQIEASLAQDRLVVAFVAEFSRGKSELINAIFFADFGARLLPSSAGRTTMCPTELQYDPSLPPSIRLLPVETRLTQASVTELKRYPDEWVSHPLDLASAEQMSEALQHVCDVTRVPVDVATRYGLHERVDGEAASANAEDTVTIPRWRHAIINFPHPLLKDGLVVLDTPGLNAIGIEPDLTLTQLPDAHVLLFVLAADAGVTRTDLDVWRRSLASEDRSEASRIVVLNKIDGLWDELRSAEAIDAEIARQADATAQMLGVPRAQVFAVSAQKALAAKINGDDLLLARSRLPALESALTDSLLPGRRDIIGRAVSADVRALAADVAALLESRRAGYVREIDELSQVRGKNHDVVAHMMARVRDEKAAFERGLARFTALRTVLTEHANKLYDRIGHDALRRTATRTREEIEAAPFTKGIRTAMADFFETIRADFDAASAHVAEIHEMMQAMYARFAAERGLERFAPPPFSMFKYVKELERLERAYNTQFNTLWSLLSTAKFALMQRFFETIAAGVKRVYDVANREAETWVRAVTAPLEAQVREQHGELRRRLESLKHINEAAGELDARVSELEQVRAGLSAEIASLGRAVEAIESVARDTALVPLAANG